jgi:hypothetical protein
VAALARSAQPLTENEMTQSVEPFQEFNKIARLSRDCVVTEKLDGTNAQVYFPEDGGPMLVGSRNRYVTPSDDNYGFARWAVEHEEELRAGLGFGRHFGEWWGQGIQRKYGLDHKRFSLFNTARWVDRHVIGSALNEKQSFAPECCHVVPVLYVGTFATEAIGTVIERMRTFGSAAAPGFDRPEGVVVWHEAARQLFKKTIEKDEVPKALAGRAA